MMEIDEFFRKVAEKNANGTLTVGDAIFGHYRILEGNHAGRVIIKTHSQIDGRDVCYFSHTLTWIWTDTIKDVRCETAYPTYGAPRHAVDRSQATWYDDHDVNGVTPRGHDW